MFRFFSLSFLILLAHPALADDLLEDRGHLQPTFFAELQDIELQGDRAYVFGVGGFIVVDIADPDAPMILGRWAPGDDRADRLYRGAVSGQYGYGGAREGGLLVIDFSQEFAPGLVMRIEPPGSSYEGCTVAGGYLYACRHAGGLEIDSLADPAAPALAGTLPGLVNAWDMAVQGGVAYVADWDDVEVVDISVPTAPVAAGHENTPLRVKRIGWPAVPTAVSAPLIWIWRDASKYTSTPGSSVNVTPTLMVTVPTTTWGLSAANQVSFAEMVPW